MLKLVPVRAGQTCIIEFVSPAILPWVPASKHSANKCTLTAGVTGKLLVLRHSMQVFESVIYATGNLPSDSIVPCTGATLLVSPDRPVHQ